MRNPNIEITPMSGETAFRDRATEINRKMAAERVTEGRFKSTLAIAATASLMALSGLAGYASAGHGYNGHTYELVSTIDGESDIIDYDLSAIDCRGYVLAGGSGLTCEETPPGRN